jgi:CheY-like chemotaxis protein
LGTAYGGDVPAVAVTALVHPEDARRALAAGFQEHVKKPIAFDHLATVVARLAEHGSRHAGARP